MKYVIWLIVTMLPVCAADFWANPAARSGNGTRFNPWSIQQAFGQRYWPGDTLWIYEGQLRATHRLLWTASCPGPGGIMTVKAWQRGRVILDVPGIDIGTRADVSCATFEGLSFTDSGLGQSESPIGFGARQRQFFDGGNEYTRKLMGFRECWFWDTGQALGNVCANVEACVFYAVGRSDYQHVLYNGDPVVPQKRIRWNLSAWNSGNVFKLPTAQNYLVASNVVLAPGGLTAPAGCQWGIIEEGLPCANNSYMGNLVVQELSGPFHQVPVHLGRGGMSNHGLRLEGNTFAGPRTPLKIFNYGSTVRGSGNVLVRMPGISPALEVSGTAVGVGLVKELRVGESITSWARLDQISDTAANVVVCNWAGSRIAAVGARDFMRQGDRFVLIPVTAPNGRWQTNEFDGRRIVLDLRPAAWPMQKPSPHPNLNTISNMLPHFGAWRALVAPRRPAWLLATELGDLTLVEWGPAAGEFNRYELQANTVDGWETIAVLPEYQHEFIDQRVGRSYRIRAFNGYIDSSWR